MTLGTILCDTSFATVDALVSKCGLRAGATHAPHEFDIISSSEHGEPEVEDELFAIALRRLAAATADGALPEWRVVNCV
jgi:hypothetical protein